MNNNDFNFIGNSQIPMRNMKPIEPHRNENLISGTSGRINTDPVDISVPVYNSPEAQIPESTKLLIKQTIGPEIEIIYNASKKKKTISIYKRLMAILLAVASVVTIGYEIAKHKDSVLKEISSWFEEPEVEVTYIPPRYTDEAREEAIREEEATDPFKEIIAYGKQREEEEKQADNVFEPSYIDGRSK